MLSSISASSSSSRVLASPLLLLHVMDRTLPEGAIIGTPAFAVVSVDGSRGACLFGTVAAALADGSTPEGLRATAASLVRRRPNALVQFGAELRSVAELAALLAAESPLVYASELAREGTWGDALALAVLASLHGLRAHVLLPRGRAGIQVEVRCVFSAAATCLHIYTAGVPPTVMVAARSSNPRTRRTLSMCSRATAAAS